LISSKDTKKEVDFLSSRLKNFIWDGKIGKIGEMVRRWDWWGWWDGEIETQWKSKRSEDSSNTKTNIK